MKKLIEAAMATCALVGTILPADAQTRFFARQKIGSHEGAASLTYVPVFSTSYTTCSGGSQSAPIQSCTRSDGQTVDNSMCGAQQTTRACASTPVCSGPVVGKMTSGGRRLVHYTFPTIVTTAVAVAKCNELASTHTTATLCPVYHTQNNYTQTGIYLFEGGSVVDNALNPDNTAVASCR